MSVFGIRHKNKRQLGIHSHRRLFVALFLFGILASSAVTTFLLNANAQLVPIRSVEITSEHSNFESGDPGAWKITKSAEWTDSAKAKITFKVESVPIYEGDINYDIILVIDNSGSMAGDKIDQVKTDATDLVDSLLGDPNNQVALVTFNTTATVLSGFTNDKSTILNHIDNITTPGCTNYYDGFLKAEEILQGYTQQNGRELILLFLTDGYPNQDTPNEVAQYKALKRAYPYMIINGIQYEMGDTVLQPIIDVSDNQFIADMSSLNNVLFEASVVPHQYDEFKITDYINDDYWTVAGLDAIEASLGDVSLEYDHDTPIIAWDIHESYRSGRTVFLEIEVDLKAEYVNSSADLLLPTNKHEEIETKIEDVPDEEMDKTDTPILKDAYSVIYEANVPSDCDASGTVPDISSHSVFTAVAMSNNQLSCNGYMFKGWRIKTPNVATINEGYFRMPGEDVYIEATWSKLSISKSMDGTIHTRASAKLETGYVFNRKVKRLVGSSSIQYYENDNNITAIRRASSIPTNIDTTDSNHIFSASDSQMPIYGWSEEGVFYYYTDADDIYTNSRIDNMFEKFKVLTDISGVRDWKTANTYAMRELFYDTPLLTDISPVSGWDTSKVTDMYEAFRSTGINDLSPLARWDTGKVENMGYLFAGSHSITSLHGLEEWNVSKVTNMAQMLYYMNGLTDISALGEWKTSSLTSLASFLESTKHISNVNALRKWDTSKVTSLNSTFTGVSDLSDISGLSEWDVSNVQTLQNTFLATSLNGLGSISGWTTSNVTNMSGTFGRINTLTSVSEIGSWDTSKVTDMSHMLSANEGLTEISGLNGWNTSNVLTLYAMFYGNKNVTKIDGLYGWDTSNVTNMDSVFYDNELLTDISGVRGWNTSNVTNMNQMFYVCDSLTDVSAVSNWNVKKVQTFSSMFSSDPLASAEPFKKWEIDSATNIRGMFFESEFPSLVPFKKWNVSQVTSLAYVFTGITATTLEGLEDWDTSNVEDMSDLFLRARYLTDISAITGWDTSKVTNMQEMFSGNFDISSLTPLYNWNTSSLTTVTNMFRGVNSSLQRPAWYTALAGS